MKLLTLSTLSRRPRDEVVKSLQIEQLPSQRGTGVHAQLGVGARQPRLNGLGATMKLRGDLLVHLSAGHQVGHGYPGSWKNRTCMFSVPCGQ
jgi:hypothetical protein